jgi:hypothetical protein
MLTERGAALIMTPPPEAQALRHDQKGNQTVAACSDHTSGWAGPGYFAQPEFGDKTLCGPGRHAELGCDHRCRNRRPSTSPMRLAASSVCVPRRACIPATHERAASGHGLFGPALDDHNGLAECGLTGNRALWSAAFLRSLPKGEMSARQVVACLISHSQPLRNERRAEPGPVLEQINGGLGVQGKCGREEEWQVTGSFDHPLPVLEPGSSFQRGS